MSLPSCWASSRRAWPISGGTWRSRGRTPPGAPGWRGRRRVPTKRAGLDFGELSSQWQRRARSVATPEAEMAAVLSPRPVGGPAQTVDEHRFGAMLSLAADGAARRRDVVAAFATAALDGADARSVEQLTRLWTPTSSDRAQVGVAEDTRTLRSVVPGGHLLATLGPRPVDPVRPRSLAGRGAGHRGLPHAVGGDEGGRRPRGRRLALGDLLTAHRAPDRPSPDGSAHRNRLPTAGVAPGAHP